MTISHLMSHTKTYRAWAAMKNRCNDTSGEYSHLYARRGITYDPRWEDFENFFADMGECLEGFTLDRRDNDGNYTKENCRYISHVDNVRNSRTAALTVEKVRLIKGLLRSINPCVMRTKAHTIIGDLFGVSRGCIWAIAENRNWSNVE